MEGDAPVFVVALSEELEEQADFFFLRGLKDFG